jgi:hypothetical protein
MAKTKGEEQHVPTLPNCAAENLTFKTLPMGTTLHRVHDVKYLPAQFNPCVSSNARFSSIFDTDGNVIPSLYCASTVAGSLMETIFHDIPYQAAVKFLARNKLVEKKLSLLITNQEINLVSLNKKALRKLGVLPELVVISEKSGYRYSRAIAQEILRLNPDVQGIEWISRQDDTTTAYVLYESRFQSSPANPVGTSRMLLEDAAYNDVLDVAEQIGVQIVPDTSP